MRERKELVAEAALRDAGGGERSSWRRAIQADDASKTLAKGDL